MGASNVVRASVIWCPRLGRYHASRVVLLVMASHTVDSDAEPAYFGGHQRLADALGLVGDPKTRQKRVSDAIRPLVELGAVTVERQSSDGRRPRYRLNLDLLAVARDAQRAARPARRVVAPAS